MRRPVLVLVLAAVVAACGTTARPDGDQQRRMAEVACRADPGCEVTVP